MIDHEKVADALIKQGGGEGFSIISAARTGQFVDLRMRIRRHGPEYGCVLDLPAPGKWSPYLDFEEFDDADDWARYVTLWISEQVLTGCTQWARTIECDSIPYFVTQEVGFAPRRRPKRH